LGLALDEPGENEETTQINGLDVLIADMVKPFSDGNTIDYRQSIEGEGFVIDNPGETGCEGCSSC
jgi:Fe-S cluster assembly iron-binding protein IscA